MKTARLTQVQASGAGSAPARRVHVRIGVALVGGAVASALGCLPTLGILVARLACVLGILGALA